MRDGWDAPVLAYEPLIYGPSVAELSRQHNIELIREQTGQYLSNGVIREWNVMCQEMMYLRCDLATALYEIKKLRLKLRRSRQQQGAL